MRLSAIERNTIKKCVEGIDLDVKVYLFGSRLDDNKKEGDIDLFLLSQKMDFKSKIILKTLLFKYLEEQKIDIIISKDLTDPFVASIFPHSLPL